LEIVGVSATRSTWLWSADPTIVTPIAFTGVHYAAGGLDGIYVVGTDGKAPTRLLTAPSIPDGSIVVPEGSAVMVEGSDQPFTVLIGVPDVTSVSVRLRRLRAQMSPIMWARQGMSSYCQTSTIGAAAE
jgi:hypothetical protein